MEFPVHIRLHGQGRNPGGPLQSGRAINVFCFFLHGVLQRTAHPKHTQTFLSRVAPGSRRMSCIFCVPS